MGTSLSSLSGTITKSAVETQLNTMRNHVNYGIAASDVTDSSITDHEVVKPVTQGFPVNGTRAETQAVYGRDNHPADLCYLDVGANYTSYVKEAEIVPIVGKNRTGIKCNSVENSNSVYSSVCFHNSIMPVSPSVATVSVERPAYIHVSANFEYLHQTSYRGVKGDGAWTSLTPGSNDANKSGDPYTATTGGVCYPTASRHDLASNGEYVGFFGLFVQVKEASAGASGLLGSHWIEIPGSRRWCLPQRIQDFRHGSLSGSITDTGASLLNQHTGSTYMESLGTFKTSMINSGGMGLYNICLGWVNPWGMGACRADTGVVWVAAQNLVIELQYHSHS